jgi:transcription antitermination factor NusG
MQIQAILDIGIPLEPCMLDISEGTLVCVQSGPMQGIKGIVTQVQNHTKLILSVESLGQAAITVDVKTVKPL